MIIEKIIFVHLQSWVDEKPNNIVMQAESYMREHLRKEENLFEILLFHDMSAQRATTSNT